MTEMIVAYDKRRGIGAQNDLLWLRDLPADLQHFKKLTIGKAVIMGRKTYESIGRPLPDRRNIVVSRSSVPETVEQANSLESALQAAGAEGIVIGGGSIYEQALPLVDRIYATEVQYTFPNASVFFPKLPDGQWQEISRESHYSDAKNKYDFDFVIFEKTKLQ